MSRWTVIHRGMTWDRERRTWLRNETVLAEGVSRGQAELIMARHPDRHNVVAEPVREGE